MSKKPITAGSIIALTLVFSTGTVGKIEEQEHLLSAEIKNKAIHQLSTLFSRVDAMEQMHNEGVPYTVTPQTSSSQVTISFKSGNCTTTATTEYDPDTGNINFNTIKLDQNICGRML